MIRTIERKCPVCGKVFTRVLEGGGGGNITYCSDECRMKSRADYGRAYRRGERVRWVSRVKGLDVWVRNKKPDPNYIPPIRTSSGVRFGYEKKKKCAGESNPKASKGNE